VTNASTAVNNTAAAKIDFFIVSFN